MKFKLKLYIYNLCDAQWKCNNGHWKIILHKNFLTFVVLNQHAAMGAKLFAEWQCWAITHNHQELTNQFSLWIAT